MPCGKHSAVNALLCLLFPELWVKLVRPRRSKALSFLLELATVMLDYRESPVSLSLIPATYVSFLHKWPVKGHHVETGISQIRLLVPLSTGNSLCIYNGNTEAAHVVTPVRLIDYELQASHSKFVLFLNTIQTVGFSVPWGSHSATYNFKVCGISFI